MQLDLAKDYLVWDNAEPVTYHRSRLAAPDIDQVSFALRRAPGSAEQSPSGGAYTAADVAWVLPQAMLTQGLTPKVGDVIVEASGTRWTALEVQFWALKQTWRLMCRNLSLVYELRHKIDVERATIARDDAGVAVQLFPPDGGKAIYADLPARVQLLSQDLTEERGLRGFQGTHAAIVDRELKVSNEDRVKWIDDGVTRHLDIVGYHNAARIDELPVLDCQLRP